MGQRADSLARKGATTGPIARQDHDTWFAARLDDPETFIWIIEADRRPIGQLRLMKPADAYEVDIYVDRSLRRSGAARQAVADGIADCWKGAPGTANRAGPRKAGQ